MAKKAVKQGNEYRRQLKTDLRRMQQLLEDDEDRICKSPDVLTSAVNALSNQSTSDPTSWSYSIGDLEFEIPLPRKIKPNIGVSDYKAVINIRAHGIANYLPHDPFKLLEVNIVISGQLNGKEVLDAWHLDRHLTNDTDDDREPNELHPLYHIQRGGHKMSHLSDGELGATMLLDAPRIAHPPLDVILAIDYVLSHYAGAKWKKFHLQSDDYASLIKNAQERYWRGFSWTFAKHWLSEPEDCSRDSAPQLFPSLAL